METGLDEIKKTVEELLDIASITGPPVDPFRIVEALRHGVNISPSEDDSLPGDVRKSAGHEKSLSSIQKVKLPDSLKGYTREIDGLYEIYVNIDQRSERQNFALAHEIFEMLLPHQAFKERLCNLGASNLLMPDTWFKDACRTTSFNLASLKKIFSTASWEAITYRTMAFREGVVSIIDNGKVSNRMGSIGYNYPPSLTHTERMALHEAMNTGETVTLDQSGINVEAYPVFEDNWKRVILVAQPSFRVRK